MVAIFPGMDQPNSAAVREKHSNLKQNLENIFSNMNIGTTGRKKSLPVVPAVQLPQSNGGARKSSEPIVPTAHLPQARFNKQKSVDQISSDSDHSGSGVIPPRVGLPRPDRPLPAPPGAATPVRSPADRPLPPVPTEALQPLCPQALSHPRIQPPVPNPGGISRSPGRAGIYFKIYPHINALVFSEFEISSKKPIANLHQTLQ